MSKTSLKCFYFSPLLGKTCTARVSPLCLPGSGPGFGFGLPPARGWDVLCPSVGKHRFLTWCLLHSVQRNGCFLQTGVPGVPLVGLGGGEGEVLYVGRGFKTLKTLKMPPGAACRLQALRWKGRPSAPRAPGVGGSGTGQRAIPWGVQGQSPWLEESWWASRGCGWRSFGVC